MKKPLIALLIVSNWLGSASGQIDDLFGYFESQVMGTCINSSFVQLHSNKLRVDLEREISENVSFGANVDWITYHGKTTWNMLEYLPSIVADAVPLEMKELYVFPFDDRIFLDNAYVRLAFRYADLTIGKQQLSFGAGYASNPVDVFNMKDLLDPTYEQPGHNAIRVDLPLRSTYGATALYVVGGEWKNSDKMISLKGKISRFDYSLLGIEKNWMLHDFTQLDSTSQYFALSSEKRHLLGVSMVGELLGIGIWSEYAYNNMERSKDYYEMVIGSDYTFDSQTYIMCEYCRNTRGKTDYEQYTLNDWMRLFSAEQKTVSRDQLYACVRRPVTDLINMGLSTITCLSDGSLALVPTVDYSPFEDTELHLCLSYYLGNEGKAYASNLGSGGQIRIRIYF